MVQKPREITRLCDRDNRDIDHKLSDGDLPEAWGAFDRAAARSGRRVKNPAMPLTR
jgi:hypothetical protein